MSDLLPSRRLFFASLVLACAFVSLPAGSTIAQDAKSKVERTDDDSVSEERLESHYRGGNVYEVESLQKRQSVRFRPESHSGIQLAGLRLLALPEVQVEVKLSQEQRTKLEPLLREFNDYETIWKWELGCICEPVRAATELKIQEFKVKVNEDNALSKILLSEQSERLAQLQNRFLLFSIGNLPVQYRGIIEDRLNLTKDQLKTVAEQKMLFLKEFDRSCVEWETETLRPFLKRQLSQEQFNLLVSQQTPLFSIQPLIRNAQMLPLARCSELLCQFDVTDTATGIGSRNDEDLSFELVTPLILPNGRFVSSDEYINRTSVSRVESKWERLAKLLISEKADVFELADFQMEALKNVVELRQQRNLSGAFSYYFDGSDDFIRLSQTKKDSVKVDEKEYRNYREQQFAIGDKIAKNVEKGIKSILIPQQQDELQFLIGIRQFPDLGVGIVLSEGLLGEKLKLEETEIEALNKLIRKRQSIENSKMAELEENILLEFSEEQQKQFRAMFGKLPEFLPTFL